MSSSKPSTHPYSLPDLTEVKLSAEDDWTKVKDRKEKKRIQNRVAQRTYRKSSPHNLSVADAKQN